MNSTLNVFFSENSTSGKKGLSGVAGGPVTQGRRPGPQAVGYPLRWTAGGTSPPAARTLQPVLALRPSSLQRRGERAGVALGSSPGPADGTLSRGRSREAFQLPGLSRCGESTEGPGALPKLRPSVTKAPKAARRQLMSKNRHCAQCFLRLVTALGISHLSSCGHLATLGGGHLYHLRR